ncbi:STAS-like domain-containing protein [Piscinibacterium candidicorallinum]|uniref:STAS-like domain-containing protein n=1 Tax=Piscinibacterium candidicorallinum TaxID=1793872 RepID=A0ABV7H9P0_9BURK
MVRINIARDFTRFPSGRFKRNGETSGEAFREKFLQPTIINGDVVEVELDGTVGYGSSFLEEAFGGLVRALPIPPDEVKQRVKIISNDKTLIGEISQYLDDAARLKNSAR